MAEEFNTELPSDYTPIGEVSSDSEEGMVFGKEAENLNMDLPPDYVLGGSSQRGSPRTLSSTASKVGVNSDLKAVQDASHFTDLNRDAVEILKTEGVVWEEAKENTEYLDAAKRMAVKRLGMSDDVEGSYALDEVLEHFNEFDVNEMVAARDYGYVSAIVADADEAQQRGDTEGYQEKIQELNDYRLMFTLKNSLPYFFQEGGRGIKALGDVIGGVAQAPSTYLGLLLPGFGKLAGQGATQATKFGITKILNEMAKRPLMTTVGIEATAGALQDIAAQNAQVTADLKEEYSALQTGAVAAISGALPVAIVPLAGKTGVINFAQRKTGDLITLSREAIQKRIDEGTASAEDLLQGKVLNEDGSVKLKGKKEVQISAKEKLELDKISADLDGKLRPLDPEEVAKGGAKEQKIAEQSGLEETFKISIASEKLKPLKAALVEITRKANSKEALKKLKPKELEELATERVSSTIARAIRELQDGKQADEAEKAVREFFEPMMKRYNLTLDDVGDIFVADASEAGRVLQQAGAIKKDLQQVLTNSTQYDYFNFGREKLDAFKKIGDAADNPRIFTEDLSTKIGGIARELDAARLAFMTSQPATSMRNAIGGIIRMPMDASVRIIDTSLQKITGAKRLTPNSDEFAVFEGFFNEKEVRAVEQVFRDAFADKAEKLFRPLIDMADATKNQTRLLGLAKFSRGLNAINTTSDNFFKRAAFTANLKRELNKMATQASKLSPEEYATRFGKEFNVEDFNLINIIKDGRFKDVFGQSKQGLDALQKATEDTLYYTYQRSPDNKLAKDFISFVHAVPFFGTSFAPFPRFMVNAMRFTYEHSPVFLMINKNARQQTAALFNKSAREQIDGYEDLAKGLLGTAAVIGATTFRMSPYAGENWYESKTPDGRTMDLRPFFPLAPYLFFGDLIARTMKGEPITEETYGKTFRDTIQTITGMQMFKTGFGLYAAEKGLADLSEGDLEGAKALAGNLVANLIETFTIPATIPQDVLNSFIGDDNARVIKDTNSRDFVSLLVNKGMRRLPYNEAMYDFMEEYGPDSYERPIPLTSPFKEGKIRRESPISRQVYGALFREKKNLVEAEFIRLKISRNKFVKQTRDPKLNTIQNLLAAEFGVEMLEKLITSEGYQNATAFTSEGGTGKYFSKSKIQRGYINAKIEQYRDVKDAIMKRLKGGTETANTIARSKFEALDDFSREYALTKYHQLIGRPENDDRYDHEVLLKLGRTFKNADVLLPDQPIN
jgi:hypothetical protein